MHNFDPACYPVSRWSFAALQWVLSWLIIFTVYTVEICRLFVNEYSQPFPTVHARLMP